MNLEKILGRRLTKIQEIFIYSAITAIFIVSIGIVFYLIFSNISILLNFFVVALISLIIPSFLYRYLSFSEVKDCEKYFPTFLDDLREAKKSGISFPEAIKGCNGEYGKLNKHIDKLKKDVSWGISIDVSLNYMKKNLIKSKLVSKSISVLTETYKSGGNIEDILKTLISSLLKIIESESYRKDTMQQHVYIMYAIFLMYIGLIITLGNLLIPMLTEIGGTGSEAIGGIQLMSSTSPCNSCRDPFCFGLCNYYNMIGGMFGFGEQDSLELYYKSLFFTMIIVQGFFTGLIAGQISARNWIEGIKHGLIMFFMGLITIILTSMVGLF